MRWLEGCAVEEFVNHQVGRCGVTQQRWKAGLGWLEDFRLQAKWLGLGQRAAGTWMGLQRRMRDVLFNAGCGLLECCC